VVLPRFYHAGHTGFYHVWRGRSAHTDHVQCDWRQCGTESCKAASAPKYQKGRTPAEYMGGRDWHLHASPHNHCKCQRSNAKNEFQNEKGVALYSQQKPPRRIYALAMSALPVDATTLPRKMRLDPTAQQGWIPPQLSRKSLKWW